MNKVPQGKVLELDRKRLTREVVVVFLSQCLLVSGFVQLDRSISLQGNLHALIGAVFILLPVLVLDRRGKPYRRYGITWGKPLGDLIWVLIAMVVTFPPIAFFAPAIWGIGSEGWQFTWPPGYPGAAVAHFVVVALPEEFFYRGYLMGRLDDIFTKRVSVLGVDVGLALVIQAILFAGGHYLVDFKLPRLAVFFPALAFGWLRAKRKSLGAPILFHAASNIFMEIFRAGFGLGL